MEGGPNFNTDFIMKILDAELDSMLPLDTDMRGYRPSLKMKDEWLHPKINQFPVVSCPAKLMTVYSQALHMGCRLPVFVDGPTAGIMTAYVDDKVFSVE